MGDEIRNEICVYDGSKKYVSSDACCDENLSSNGKPFCVAGQKYVCRFSREHTASYSLRDVITMSLIYYSDGGSRIPC